MRFRFVDSRRRKDADLHRRGRECHSEAGLALYYGNDFAEASMRFTRLPRQNPPDRAAQLYMERSADLMARGVPEIWEGDA